MDKNAGKMPKLNPEFAGEAYESENEYDELDSDQAEKGFRLKNEEEYE